MRLWPELQLPAARFFLPDVTAEAGPASLAGGFFAWVRLAFSAAMMSITGAGRLSGLTSVASPAIFCEIAACNRSRHLSLNFSGVEFILPLYFIFMEQRVTHDFDIMRLFSRNASQK
jgi:hypothetical protein